MTVIATDGRTMAGDSLTSAAGQILRRAPKVRRLRDGRIAGASGPTSECIQIIRWLDEQGDADTKRPELGEDVVALILNQDGTVDWIDNKLELVCGYELPAAIGSGGDIAIGAMLAGASPEEAAKIACSRQTDCGGDITVLAA